MSSSKHNNGNQHEGKRRAERILSVRRRVHGRRQVSDGSTIEWLVGPDGKRGASWNVTRGCTRADPSCDNCYAMRMAGRFGKPGLWGEGLTRTRSNGQVDWSGQVVTVPEKLEMPLRWRRPRRVFVSSTSDIFHPRVPFEFIVVVWGVMAAAPQHTFLVLTKRPNRAREFLGWLPGHYTGPRRVSAWASAELQRRVAASPEVPWPLPNVHLGTSAGRQKEADERIPELLQCPAALHWVSLEPLVGPVTLRDEWLSGTDQSPRLDWVVAGGESGRGARECDTAWLHNIVEQCKSAGVPVFVKQLGSRPVASASRPASCSATPMERRMRCLSRWSA